jgi:tetrahydromethanopterin S-methyltransferase subunit A
MAVKTGRDASGQKSAAEQLFEAAKARKCWACNCLGSTLSALDKALPKEDQSSELRHAIDAAKARAVAPEIECRGCEVCFPANALNALRDVVDSEALDAAACPAEDVAPREGWPPLAGNYTVLGYQRPVAICTLNSEDLWEQITDTSPNETAIVGTLNTENLGIERLIQNVTANPNIRFLIICGEDSRRKIGHLPGHSLVALGQYGVGERSKIIGAKGKRPVLRNIKPGMIEHFRNTVEILDMIGETSAEKILLQATRLASTNPEPATPYRTERVVTAESGHIPDRMISDPNGFFVIYPDRTRGVISLEHFTNDGVLTTIIQGRTATEVYCPAVEKNLLSRLDHACYLGRELARAERCLGTGGKYVQDAAPDRSTVSQSCGCSGECH